jgi:hypothetical protein
MFLVLISINEKKYLKVDSKFRIPYDGKYASLYLILPAALWPQPLTEMSARNQTFNKEISQEFLCSWMPPSLVWTFHGLSNT